MRPFTTALVLLAGFLWTSGMAKAQPGVQASGTSYYTFAEPGAPTMDIRVVGEQVRNGIYNLQRETSLTDLMVLSGGGPTSADTDRQIIRALVRVLREQGGVRTPVYEATTEQAIREPGQHPVLQDGDVVEFDYTYEEVRGGVSVLDVLQVASRVASVISAVILIYTRVDRL